MQPLEDYIKQEIEKAIAPLEKVAYVNALKTFMKILQAEIDEVEGKHTQ